MPIVPVKPGRREGPFHGPCRARVSLGKQRRAIEKAARALLSSSTSCRQAIRTLVRWTDGRVALSGTNPLVADQESRKWLRRTETQPFQGVTGLGATPASELPK